MGLAATSVMYNLPGVKNLPHMDGPTLAKIFLGQITTWDDPAIKKLNKGVNLPSTKITIAHRSDDSGTTFNFTDYLATVSPAWKSQIGTGTSGQLARRRRRQAEAPGSPRSSRRFWARSAMPTSRSRSKNHFSYFAMKNRSGKFATPGREASSRPP